MIPDAENESQSKSWRIRYKRFSEFGWEGSGANHT